MVKKITGKGSSTTKSTNSIRKSQSVKTSKVKNVGNVSSTTKKDKTSKVKKTQIPINSETRDKLLKLVTEEAEILVKNNHISKKKQETVIKAVKMTIDASIKDLDIDEEEEF